MRRSGVVAQRRFNRSSSSHSARAKSVFTKPGATQLTRTPFGPHSPARLRHNPKSAALEIPYAPITVEPRRPPIEETIHTEPPPRAAIGRIARTQTQIVPL